MTPGDAPEFITWPPEGYIPAKMVFPRWSFSIANADFTGTKVSMKDKNGTSIALQLEELDNEFGDRTIVWVPEGINSNVMEDTVYSVTLEDVAVDGELIDFSYSVILFDPDTWFFLYYTPFFLILGSHNIGKNDILPENSNKDSQIVGFDTSQ